LAVLAEASGVVATGAAANAAVTVEARVVVATGAGAAEAGTPPQALDTLAAAPSGAGKAATCVVADSEAAAPTRTPTAATAAAAAAVSTTRCTAYAMLGSVARRKAGDMADQSHSETARSSEFQKST